MAKFECVIRGNKRGAIGARHTDQLTCTVEADAAQGTMGKPFSGATWEAIKFGHENGLEHILVQSITRLPEAAA